MQVPVVRPEKKGELEKMYCMFKTRYSRRLLMSIQDSGTKHTLRSGFADGETLL